MVQDKAAVAPPSFWNSTAETILNATERHLLGCRYKCTHGETVSQKIEDIFVDNASLMATADGKKNSAERLQENIQRHERYLHSTGGALAAHKSFWLLVQYAWEDGKAVMFS